jgi:hypothetical protein
MEFPAADLHHMDLRFGGHPFQIVLVAYRDWARPLRIADNALDRPFRRHHGNDGARLRRYAESIPPITIECEAVSRESLIREPCSSPLTICNRASPATASSVFNARAKAVKSPATTELVATSKISSVRATPPRHLFTRGLGAGAATRLRDAEVDALLAAVTAKRRADGRGTVGAQPEGRSTARRAS